MRRVFIDVGGFRGDSALAALDPIFGFDVVYCFEPVPFLAQRIKSRIASRRLVVIAKALSDRDERRQLHHAGSLAGSFFGDAPSYGDSIGSVDIEAVDAASFFSSHVSRQDFVRVKLNCEGAEVVVIEALHSAGLLWALRGALIDFDSDKIGTLKGRSDLCKEALRGEGVHFFEPPQVQYGMVTNYGGVRNWLLVSGARASGWLPVITSAAYNVRMFCDSDVNGYHKLGLKKRLGLVR